MFQRTDSSFVEQLVRHQNSPMQTIGMIMTYTGGVFISLLVAFLGLSGILIAILPPVVVYLFQMVALFLFAGGIYLTIRLGAAFHKEYEYILTAGELDIDCIVSKRKRSRLLTLKVNGAEKGGKYQPEKLERERFDARIFACTSKQDPENRYLVVQNAKKGRVLLVFTPDEKMLSALRVYLPRHFSDEFLKG